MSVKVSVSQIDFSGLFLELSLKNVLKHDQEHKSSSLMLILP